MFYKVAANTESLLLGGNNRIRFLKASGHQDVCQLICICFCLKTPYFTYIVDSLTPTQG